MHRLNRLNSQLYPTLYNGFLIHKTQFSVKEKLAPRYLHAKGSSTEKNQTSYDSILPSVMDNIRCYWQLDSNGRYNLLCSLIDPIVKEGVDVRANHSNLVRSICSLSEPVKMLADMRLHLQTQMNRIEKERNNLCIQLDRIISEQLEKLLGQDNLQMKRISWEDDSFDIIEKICLHEAVHPIKDHRDIKRRLGPDRRVYGLFVDSLPNEPLVFIHIALLPSMPNSIHSILDAESAINLPENFHCAICYTITTQNAFGNINLGRHLITSAIESLQQEYPQLKTFATLSPIPGFRRWVLNQQANNHIDLPKGIIGWDQRQEEYKETLMDLCSKYILSVNDNQKRHVIDPVANFHFSNGAIPDQIHWMANTSDRGSNESYCMMINYIYEPHKINERGKAYRNQGVAIATGGPYFR